MLTLQEARANRFETDWDALPIPIPWFIGRRLVTPPIDALIPLIDWRDGWPTTQLQEAAEVALFPQIVRDARLMLRGVYGFWPANSQGDDIIVYKDDARSVRLGELHTLRQQEPPPDGGRNRALADFVAPRESFAPDYIGMFAVSAGADIDEIVREHDDRGHLARAVVDRIVNAFVEYLHLQARRDWGYATDEPPASDQLRTRAYRGMRALSGQMPFPDWSETQDVLRLLNASEIGIQMDPDLAVTPASAVSGLYLSHPEARLFDVGPICPDQVDDYAQRKGVSVGLAERYLDSYLHE